MPQTNWLCIIRWGGVSRMFGGYERLGPGGCLTLNYTTGESRDCMVHFWLIIIYGAVPERFTSCLGAKMKYQFFLMC